MLLIYGRSEEKRDIEKIYFLRRDVMYNKTTE